MTTTQKLIKESYILSTVVSDGFEDVTGHQITEGLKYLNEIISYQTAIKSLTPYITEYEFSIGQNLGIDGSSERYFIPNLNEQDTVTLTLNNIRYNLYFESSKSYQGGARVEGLSSIPSSCFLRRCLGGSILFFYPLPSQTYTAKIWGKFRRDSVAINQVLEDSFEPFFVRYLRYELANEICNQYGLNLAPSVNAMLLELRKSLKVVSPIDMKAQTIKTMRSNRFGYYYYLYGNNNG